MKTLVLNSADLQRCLNYKKLTDVMEVVLSSKSLGEARNFPRHVVSMTNKSALGFMPAIDAARNIAGYKIVGVFPENAAYGKNPHQGLVALIDAQNGDVLCLLNGETKYAGH